MGLSFSSYIRFLNFLFHNLIFYPLCHDRADNGQLSLPGSDIRTLRCIAAKRVFWDIFGKAMSAGILWLSTAVRAS
jgi:hypothetical protein